MSKNKQFRKFCPSGFTLIEMLMVVSIMTMLSVVLCRSLLNGLEIWNRAQRSVIEEDIGIFFDKISYDLRNSFDYSLLAFEGKRDSIVFPTVVRTLKDRKKTLWGEVDYVNQMGRVQYYWDRMEKSLFRRQANYSQAVNKKFGKERLLVEPISSLNFFYYYTQEGKTEMKRKSTGNMPSAVKIQLEFLESTGKVRRVERLVNIPIAMY